MLKTVYFDLGNVLCFFDHAKMFANISACSGLSISHIKQILLADGIQESYELGKIDTPNIYRLFKSKSPKPFSLHDFTYAMSDIFTPNTELWPVVEQLKARGIRLILLSNTCESHFIRAYSDFSVLRLFDHKILSFEVGYLKPDPRIFNLALSLAECTSAECFYTDDIPAYIRSAKKAGLRGAVFTSVATLKQQIT